MNQRVIDFGLVSELESVHEDADALEPSRICIAKQMGRCKSRVTFFASRRPEASKMQRNDMIVGM